ncbi:hypothetical protein RAS1_05010 [Phycisphaerae bacterium RAS1]|nr:hypothetical protein RAS1_05010 [Phycisphaerae bacterium RAS1]
MGSAFYSGFDPLQRWAWQTGPIQLCDQASFSVTGYSRR